MAKDQSVVIHGVTVMPGDIVFIKFRKLEEVLKDKRKTSRVHDLMNHYQIDNHTNTFLKGCGHFQVRLVRPKDGRDSLRLNPERSPGTLRKRASPQQVQKEQRLEDSALDEIVINDHNTDNNWDLNEILIEEIRVDNDAAESYFSERHEVSLVLINNVLYLNGLAITPAESKIFEMFEKVLADAAISKMFAHDDNDEEDEDSF
jgi:hypothetical protein